MTNKSSPLTTNHKKKSSKKPHNHTAPNPSQGILATTTAASKKISKSQRQVLLKHLSTEEKQKIAHLVLTIHQLTQQKLFYESKYESILPKLKEMMQKFEERSHRLGQYQSAMKRMHRELEEWKERSVQLDEATKQLSQQTHTLTQERDHWREQYESLLQQQQQRDEDHRRRQRHKEVQCTTRRSSQGIQVHSTLPERSSFSPQKSSSRNNYNSQLPQSVHYTRDTHAHYSPSHNSEYSQSQSKNQSLNNSDNESVYSTRQREVDDLLRRSEAVLNRSRASRPSTPEELLHTRRRREELLRKSSDLHRVSERNQQDGHSLSRNHDFERPIYTEEDVRQSNRLKERQQQQEEAHRSASSRANQNDANDLFHFVDILEQQPDSSAMHEEHQRHAMTDVSASGNPLEHTIEDLKTQQQRTHMAAQQVSFEESSFMSQSSSHQQAPPVNSSEAWFEKADTFQENDIFDIIS